MFVPFSPKIMRMSTWNSGLWNRRLRHMQNVHFASDIKTIPFLLRSSSISHGLFHNTKILNHKLMVFWPFPEIYLGPTDDLRGFFWRELETPAYMSSATLRPQAQDPKQHVVPKKNYLGALTMTVSSVAVVYSASLLEARYKFPSPSPLLAL
jgi:hypothetical protein